MSIGLRRKKDFKKWTESKVPVRWYQMFEICVKFCKEGREKMVQKNIWEVMSEKFPNLIKDRSR